MSLLGTGEDMVRQLLEQNALLAEEVRRLRAIEVLWNYVTQNASWSGIEYQGFGINVTLWTITGTNGCQRTFSEAIQKAADAAGGGK